MIRNIKVGIDVGTHSTRVVVAEYFRGENAPKIIGTGTSESKGLRHGYVVNVADTAKSIAKAIDEAERNSGIKIKRVFISIGGISLGSETSAGSAIISKADGEVTSLDVAKAISESEENLKLTNKKIIHTIPMLHKLDGKEILGKPEGMKGVKLEIKTLFITALEQHLDNLLAAVRDTGVEVIDVVASPIAASHVALSDRQKIVGCALANIGAETVSIAVFENGNVISLQVFSIGSTDITNDIALGLKVTLEEAEGLKTGSIIGDYSKKKLDEIIEARLKDIFELIDNHLKKIKRNGLLPAGIIITGGGSNIASIADLSKNLLKLPSKIGAAEMFANSKTKVRDSLWFVATGLCIAGKDGSGENYESGSFDLLFRKFKTFWTSIIRQLLP